jgi:hypothetical protein
VSAVPLSPDRQAAWFRALDHARLQGVKPTYCIAGDYYRVTSKRTGEIYRVDRISDGDEISYACTCQAGRVGHVCWHKALVAALPHEINLRKQFDMQRKAHPWEGIE